MDKNLLEKIEVLEKEKKIYERELSRLNEKVDKIENTLLEVKDLKKFFPVYGGIFRKQVATVKAVDGISFTLKKGETIGLVGESGCGKSTTGKTVIRLHPATYGEILYRAGSKTVDLAKLSRQEMIEYRSNIQMIFQDPYSSLNPRMTVNDIIKEPMQVHPHKVEMDFDDKVIWLMEKCGLRAEYAQRYPHEFSGGQRQRIGIARALATNPNLIIADEPVSALDVSVQAQVLNLMVDLQKEFNLAYIFIAHDLSVVRYISDRIAVMYLGNIVEIGDAEEVYNNPQHPYSKALLSAVPEPDPKNKNKGRVVLQGDVPSPLAKPSGCGFRTRCPIARPECALKIPELIEKSNGSQVACPYV